MLPLYVVLLNKAMAVEECDATKMHIVSNAGLKKFTFFSA
jgi:hypothetical protein